MRKIVAIMLILFFGSILFSGCASMKGESTGEYIDDATITTKVNAIIVEDPNAHYLKIEVTTTQGDVVLQGFVINRDTEAELVTKIKKIRGVKSVKSLLRIEDK